MNFIHLFDHLEKLEKHASSIEETIISIEIIGDRYDGFESDFQGLLNLLQSHDIEEDQLTIEINTGERIKPAELSTLPPGNLQKWTISLKKRFSKQETIDNYATIFFYKEDNFIALLDPISPFKKQSVFITNSPLALRIRGYSGQLIGPKLFIGSEKSEIVFAEPVKFPEPAKILETIHFITNEDVIISPGNFVLTNGHFDSRITKSLLKKSIQCLAACLINEYYSEKKIVLKGIGIKRTETCLETKDLKECEITVDFQIKLLETVLWVFEEKTETRLKLLIDRITLDFNTEKSYIKNLYINLAQALIQAKEQYGFVILERKDQYLKEVKELLKDLKGQSDLYSSKLRGILSNWLRDILAAFASLFLTVLSKRGDFSLKDYNANLDYILKFLAIYYFISVILQTIIDFKDIVISLKELWYWKDVTRMYMPSDEFDRHFKKALCSRKLFSFIFYLIIVGLYIFFGLICWNYPLILNKINTQMVVK